MAPFNYTIREAVTDELKFLQEFEQGVIQYERPFAPNLKENPIVYYDIQNLIEREDAHVLVVVVDNKLVGSGYIKTVNSSQYHKNLKHGYIGFIYVEHAFRGNKISGLILDSLKKIAKEKGLKELRLDVYSNNIGAIKSYKRFGFTKGLVNMKIEI